MGEFLAGTGPPPKGYAARERDQRRRHGDETQLPAEGRRGRAPTWPLEIEPSDAERRLWAKLWRTPQAVAWERHGWTRVVARYARVVVKAEGDLDEKLLPEARQLEDRLGLTPMSMLRLRWKVVTDEVAAQRKPAQGGRYGELQVADFG